MTPLTEARGRRGDGGGARRSLGGRLREHRPDADGGRDDRPGAPRRCSRAATGSSSRCSGRTRATDIYRDLGLLELFAAKTADRPAFRQLVDIPAVIEHLSDVAPARARLPPGGGEHRADARACSSPTRASTCPASTEELSTRAAARHGGGAGRPGAGGARWARRARRRPASCSSPTTSQILTAGFFHADPHPGQPEVVGRADLLPRLRHGRRGRPGDARAPAAPADGVLAARTSASSPT